MALAVIEKTLTKILFFAVKVVCRLVFKLKASHWLAEWEGNSVSAGTRIRYAQGSI